MLMVRPDRTRSGGAGRRHGSGLDHRALVIAYLAFAAFAGLVAVFSGGDDAIWGGRAACRYARTGIPGWRWHGSLAAPLPALIFGLVVPPGSLGSHAASTAD